MLDQHDFEFMIRQVKNLHVREFSRTIFHYIHDNNCYMEVDIKGILHTEPYTSRRNPTPKTYLLGESLQFDQPS
jgi:hypothetical protein